MATGISSAEEIFGWVRRDAGLMYRMLCEFFFFSGFVGEGGRGCRRTCGIGCSGRRSEGPRRLLEVKRLVGDSGPMGDKVSSTWLRDGDNSKIPAGYQR
jgi:hypothetical protein